MNLEKAFGEELRKAREQKGYSQEELGFESDHHRTYISQLERGLKSPTLKAIVKISAALGGGPRKWMELQMNHDLARVDKSEYSGIARLGGIEGDE